MSPGFGPLGNVDPDLVVYHRAALYRESVWTDKIDTRVDLIKAVSGMDGRLIDASLASGARAIVIEAMGRGNLPLETLPAIEKAISQGVLIVIASRAHTGRVLPEYGYEGGGKHLSDIGAILAGDMQGLKVRLKLMALFGKYDDSDIVRRFFLQSRINMVYFPQITQIFPLISQIIRSKCPALSTYSTYSAFSTFLKPCLLNICEICALICVICGKRTRGLRHT
jgi:hypothetical protein